jgi:tetratricopeptide (TPR) repeat protein
MPTRTLLASILLILLAATACAQRPAAALAPPAAIPRPDIDDLISRGCYSCLERGLAAAVAANRTPAAFEAAVLLVLRSKELGLPFQSFLDRARALVPGPAWNIYLDVAAAVPLDPFSADRDEVLEYAVQQRRPVPVLDQWRRDLAAGPASPLFNAYVDVSLACSVPQLNQRDAATTAAKAAFGHVPLIQYRLGICGHPDLLDVLVRSDSDFTDLGLERGRAALQRERPDYGTALAHWNGMRAEFSVSPTLMMSIGQAHQAREEWTEALAAFEATLSLVPTHRDALLGSTVSLSHLSRHDEAIGTATRLVELRNWFVADAHYWRAWNGYRLGRLAAARSDVDAARALDANASTLLLSGLIAWREGRLDSAEAEFGAALAQDFGYCEAALYLGGVRANARNWPLSLEAFEHAERCFDLSIVTRRKAVAELAATEASATAYARDIASHERAIAEAALRKSDATANIALLRVRVASAR